MDNSSDSRNDLILIRAQALASAGRMAWFQGDFEAARAQLLASLELFQRAGDVNGTLDAISGLILVLTRTREHSQCMSLIQQAQLLLESGLPQQGLLPTLPGLARAAAFMAATDALPIARNWGQESLSMARDAGDKRSLAWSLDALALCDYYEGKLKMARVELEEGIPLFEELGDLWGLCFEKWLLANVARRQGCLDEAHALNAQAIAGQSHNNSRQGMPYMIDNCAFVAIEEKQPQLAIRLLAASQALADRLNNTFQPLYEIERTGYEEMVRSMVASAQWDELWQQGYALPTEKAIALALEASKATR